MKPFSTIFVLLSGLFQIVLATDNNLNVVVTPELAETCRREIDAILKTNNSYTLQMNLATCIHAAKHYSVALEIYSFIETSFPSHAYVHVNKAAAHLQLGEIGKARDSMRKYFDAVGGIDGSGIPTDTIAAQRGSPCSNVSSFKFDCVNALNNFAAIEPVTSGIETFDYFLSGDLLEHPYRTQLEVDHYTEQVVLFDGQAISFPDTQHHLPQDEALAAGDAHSNVTALEQITLLQKQDTHLFVCFQNIAKIQPRFDHVLVDILQADPKAHIILQASRHAAQTSTLTNRLEKTLRERLCGYHASQHCSTQSFQSRIHFIARIPSDQIIEFLQRCGTSSVVLQPFPLMDQKLLLTLSTQVCL